MLFVLSGLSFLFEPFGTAVLAAEVARVVVVIVSVVLNVFVVGCGGMRLVADGEPTGEATKRTGEATLADFRETIARLAKQPCRILAKL